MIHFGDNDRVARFFQQHLGRSELPAAYQCISWIDGEEEIQAAIGFHHCDAVNCVGDIAVPFTHFPRELLHAALWYVFGQLGVRRLTMYVTETNIKSINFVEKLGAYHEATLQDGSSDGDVRIYCLRPERCLIWSKLNEQKRRRIATPGT